MQQAQGLYVGNLPQMRSRGIYGLISFFSAYEHRFDYFTDWVLLVTILINPKCWSISLFCHGYREQQSVGVQRSYLRVRCVSQSTYINNAALFLKSMSFPVDILNNYSHEDLENSAEDYFFDLRWRNPNSPEFFSLPDRRKVKPSTRCGTGVINVLVDPRFRISSPIEFQSYFIKVFVFSKFRIFMLNSTFFTLYLGSKSGFQLLFSTVYF